MAVSSPPSQQTWTPPPPKAMRAAAWCLLVPELPHAADPPPGRTGHKGNSGISHMPEHGGHDCHPCTSSPLPVPTHCMGKSPSWWQLRQGSLHLMAGRLVFCPQIPPCFTFPQAGRLLCSWRRQRQEQGPFWGSRMCSPPEGWKSGNTEQQWAKQAPGLKA